MAVHWHSEALREADAAAAFYQQQRPGLEQRFLDALEDAITRIQHHPLIYRLVEANVRQCKLPRFPYGVIYRLHGADIQIIAVMHIRQSPKYWMRRQS